MLKKKSIYVDECQPGMRIAETIFNDHGAVLVAEDNIIDERTLAKIENFGIVKVLVYDGIEETIEEKRERVKLEYNEKVKDVENIVKDIGLGKDLKMDTVNNIASSLIETNREYIDIMYCINQVKDVQAYTYAHCVNVSLICMMIGKWLKYKTSEIKELVLSGLLHDIGKAKIDINIINKPGKLTDDEYEEVKKHVLYGYRILDSMPDVSKKVAVAVLMHHERDDGSGYIMGAKSNQISQFAKIVAIADVFDAMTSDRCYREKQSPFNVFEHIENGTFGKFDPNISLTFLNHMAAYFIGDRCKVSSGEIAEIVKINPTIVSRPLLKIGTQYVDLVKEKDLKIVEIM